MEQHITSIKFSNYKSFKKFSVALNEFNILVGPNNAGKSTVIGSLKILAEGLRKARARKPDRIDDPNGNQILGYEIDLSQVPVATENVFHDYDDSVPAVIRFRLSDGSHLQIFFPERNICYFNYEATNHIVKSPKEFKDLVKLEIGYVPILGPVEHTEKLYQKEAARLALLTHTASRNFRNIWFHYPEDFKEFKELVQTTWPGLDISPPEINTSGNDNTLDMFCPEERIPREIYWAGFGFQVWCQMLTYIIKNKKSSLFLIDEPDIYLHSDLQRQLLGILKNLGPDIIIATHSTELISEADLNDILLINKTNQSGKRIKDPSQLRDIFQVLGSNLNPVLTQIAKSKRVLFVEGKDFLVFSRISRLLGYDQVANRSDFAVVPVEGFNPTRLNAFKDGIEKTIGSKIKSAIIFDKDYRTNEEINSEIRALKNGNIFVHIHTRKEIENFLLIPKAIEKAIKQRIKEVNKRTGKTLEFDGDINEILASLTNEFKIGTQAQLQSHQFKFKKSLNPKLDESTIIESILGEFEIMWTSLETRLEVIPGKEFLSAINRKLQQDYRISLSQANIINALDIALIPEELKELIARIDRFREE
ncbi:ATP-dependent nuclease [Flagellimonas amoyensis]|uniref:ATP-dependent nuclease n=1 Tax=Flagellimonas amoyensis TaxID=2169401 RepID=UPI000D33213E|nr:ATP-binding protein [Allomuricauda amoyensis]